MKLKPYWSLRNAQKMIIHNKGQWLQLNALHRQFQWLFFFFAVSGFAPKHKPSQRQSKPLKEKGSQTTKSSKCYLFYSELFIYFLWLRKFTDSATFCNHLHKPHHLNICGSNLHWCCWYSVVQAEHWFCQSVGLAPHWENTFQRSSQAFTRKFEIKWF